MSSSTLYNDPGKLKNFVSQYLKYWAFRVSGQVVYVGGQNNVYLIKDKLTEAGYPGITVEQSSDIYI
jgi:hypothetical protein